MLFVKELGNVTGKQTRSNSGYGNCWVLGPINQKRRRGVSEPTGFPNASYCLPCLNPVRCGMATSQRNPHEDLQNGTVALAIRSFSQLYFHSE